MTPHGATRGQAPISGPPPPAGTITRFAPSPTGRLHLGHAWSALLARRFAAERGGAFLLRIEDIDASRSRAEFVDGIVEDLTWLGLRWDGPVLFQSRRLGLYADALDRLRARGLVYPCFCTRAAIANEIARSASAPHGLDGPIYPGTCRRLKEGERSCRMTVEPHAWRVDVSRALDTISGSKPLTWYDDEHGIVADPARLGDVVLARKDAPASYHLAVTIDDAMQGVTDVVRGTDLHEATHVHRLLQALLGLPTPTYHHHPLLTDAAGRRLAKRTGAPTLLALREAGANGPRLAADLLAGRLPYGYSTCAA